VPDEMRAVRTEMLELADRNLARMAGTRSDTYGRHPDYSEIGRLVSTMKLVDQMSETRPVVAKAEELLTW
jgi:hypothetical protein